MPRIFHEDEWEVIWLASSVMTYKLTIESEHKAKEIDSIRRTQLEEMKKINKKLDLIMSKLEIDENL